MPVATEGKVLVVGAGPTGLLLAGDLAAAGVPVTVLERRERESSLSRAFAVHARTLEMLDARGLADELIATGQKLSRLRLYETVSLDLSRLRTRFPFVLITPQYHTERLLERRARALGAEIIGGSQVTGVHQDAGQVNVDVRAANGATETMRASYAVGADGVRSTVRHALGLPFPGRSVIRSVMLADVRLSTPPPDTLQANTVEAGFAFAAPFGDGWYRVIAWNRHRQVPETEPVGLDEIRQITRQALGSDFGMHDARWMSRFHNEERQVPRYRSGRVFLAGDAAHVHSPAGGHGMNTGLQDAANLSWKIAAVARGWAGDSLLDSYHAERFPVGRMVLRMSGSQLRLTLLESGALRRSVALAGAAALHVPPVADRAARAISGIGIGYATGSGAGRLAGRRMPDVPLAAHQGRLYEVLRGGRFVLLTAGEHPAAAARWADRIEIGTRPWEHPRLILVRPDGYIAWGSDERDPGRRDAGLREALTRWCGAPGEFPARRDGGLPEAMERLPAFHTVPAWTIRT
jgi:2-polyprenyl-6-methoxyphenol hydroxylase-like FAD-dependent oxidoreductase